VTIVADDIMTGKRVFRFVQSLDDYAQVFKRQAEPFGITVVTCDEFKLNGYNALRIKTRSSAKYPSGTPFQVEQQVLIVDYGANRYTVVLSYPPEAAEKYEELFGTIIQTFKIVQ
jgi:hypothetical protein